MSLPIKFPMRRTAPDMTDSLRPSQKRDWGWGGVEHERKRNGRTQTGRWSDRAFPALILRSHEKIDVGGSLQDSCGGNEKYSCIQVSSFYG